MTILVKKTRNRFDETILTSVLLYCNKLILIWALTIIWFYYFFFKKTEKKNQRVFYVTINLNLTRRIIGAF
jgi:hypothetical protein